MPIPFPRLCLSWIALAAFAGTLLVSGEVSASCAMMPAAGACPPACGCCNAPESTIPARQVASPTTVRQHQPSRDGQVCRDIPAGGCTCRTQVPTVPEPEKRRAGDSRPDPGRDLAIGWSGLGILPQPLFAPNFPRGGPAPRSPVYLLTSRLLI